MFIIIISPRINPDFVPNREFTAGSDGPATGGSSSKVAEIYLFSVEWCNHSKLAKPEWDKVKAELDGKQPDNSHYN